LKDSTAKINLPSSVRSGWVEFFCRVTFTAFTETWIQSNYLINSLSYWPEPLKPEEMEATVLRSILELIESA